MVARNKPESATDQPFKRNLALIIGIDDYQNGYPRLETAVNDAQAVADLLAQKPHHYQVTTLIDVQATTIDLKDTLDKTTPGSWASQIGPEDRVLFYFAGHGIKAQSEEGQGPAGFLLLQNADFATTDEGRLGMVQLQAWLADLPCRHLLVVLDCCFAGAMRWSAPGMRDIPPEVIHKERYDHYVEYPAWQLITSAGDDEKAMDIVRQGMETTPAKIESIPEEKIPEVLRQIRERSTDDNHSPFAKALIEALQDGAGDIYPPGQPGQPAGDGLITASELIIYLENRVSQVAREAKHRQVPKLHPLAKHSSGEFVFFNPNREMQLKPAPDLDISNNPYRPDALTEADAELFYGRESEVRKLLEAVLKEPLTLVTGASGVGKSSLVRAGLLPRFTGYKPPKRPGESESTEPSVDLGQWCVLPTFIPDENPAEALLDLLQTQLGDDASIDPLPDLPTLLTVWAKANPQCKLLLVVDQLERVLLQPSAPEPAINPESEPFVDHMRTLIDFAPCHLVLAIREDHKAELEKLLEVKNERTFEVAPLDSESDLQKALERPAWAKVLYYDPPELVTNAVKELNRGPGALSLLAQFGSRMYLNFIERRSQSRALTRADYRAVGSVTNFICDRVTEIYNGLEGDEANDEQATMRRVMLRLMEIEGGELSRRRIPRSELDYGEKAENRRVEAILKQLTAARLLVWNAVGDEAHVELAHDALLYNWPLMKKWRTEERDETLLLQRRITRAAKEWTIPSPTQLTEAPLSPTLTERLRHLWDRLTTSPTEGQAQRLWHNSVYLPQVEDIAEGDPYKDKHWLKRSVRRGWDYFFPRSLLPSKPHWLNALESVFVNLSLNKRRRGHRLVALFIVNIFLVLATATGYALVQQRMAEEQRIEAEKNLLSSEQNLYIAQMNLAQAAWQAEDPDRLLNLIGLQEQSPIRTSLRSFDWYYYWRLAHSDYKILEGHEERINSVAYSPDGQFIASGGYDQILRLWVVDSGQEIQLGQHDNRIKSVTFSPNGKYLASAGLDNVIKVWDIASNQQISPTLTYDNDLSVVAFSPHEDNLLVSGSPDGTIQLWDLMHPSNPYRLEGHNDRVTALSFTPDGNALVSSSGKLNEFGEIIVWNLITKEISLQWRGHNSIIESVAVSPISDTIASGGADGLVYLWRLADGKALARLDGHGGRGVTDVSFSQNGDTVASGSGNDIIKLWDVAKGVEVGVLMAPLNSVTSIEFGPDGKTLVSGSAKGIVRVWTVDWGKPFRLLNEHNRRVTAVAFSNDGQMLASGSLDNDIVLWDALDGTLKNRLSNHESYINALAFSPTADLLASASDDNTLKLWHLTTGQVDTLFQSESVMDAVESVIFSSNGELLVAATSRGSIYLWEMPTQILLNTLEIPRETFRTIAISPDNRYLAAGGYDEVVRLWDLTDQDPHPQTLIKHQAIVDSLRFSPDGRFLASGSDDWTVQLWDLETDRLQAILNHPGPITSIDFHPDGKSLATGTFDNLVRLWDITTGLERGVLRGPKQFIESVAFSPDGSILAAGSWDGRVYLWYAAEQSEINSILANRPNISTFNENKSFTIMAPIIESK